MDSVDEDISARVLLKKVLQTELPRSPVTRSVTRGRRSSRHALAESPGVTLRHRLKHKLHQSASQSPLPPRKRQRSLGENADPPSPDSATGLAPPLAPPPAPSLLFDEDITARGLLRGIIQTESEVSLLVSGQPALQESELNPAESSVSSAGERTDGLSGAELSDLTLHTEPLTHVVRGLSRRKPPRAFSVSAFEKELDGIPDKAEEVVVAPQEKSDASQDLDLSSGSKSGLNLTLKTPFVDKHTERAGLQRKVSNRRLPSVDAFDEAVQKCLEQGANQDHSVVQDGKTLEDSSWQKFTLGLNDVTELYVQPAGTTAQSRKDEMLIPSAELEEDAENGEEHEPDRDEEQESRENHVSKIHDLQDPEPSKQELKEHDVEYPSQEEEEVVPSSQEAGEALSLSPEDDIILAPTQAMTDSLPEPQEDQDPETEEEKEEEKERVSRRAHRSEGGDCVSAVPVGPRVTKSLGFGLNPREKVLQDLMNGSSQSLQDFPTEERDAENSPASPPLCTPAEVTTPEQRSQQHDTDLPEEETPELTEDDDQEEVNQTEEEEDAMETEPTNQSPEPSEVLAPEEEEDEEEEEEEELPELAEDDGPEEVNQSVEEEDVMDTEPTYQSPEPSEVPAPEEAEEEEEEEEDDDARSAELSMKTPAFVKQRRAILSPTAQATPTALKELNAGPTPQITKRPPRRKPQTGSNALPKSYVMSVFKHFAKTKVAADVFPVINEILQKYFDRLADDLEAYAGHAKRKTIEVEDFELLMRRQGFVTDSTPVNVLIERYLPLEYRKLLIPVATSGNKVIPTQRR